MLHRGHVEEDISHREEQWQLLYKAKSIIGKILQIQFQNIERTKRMPYSCHFSCVMSSDSGLNSWEDVRRRPDVPFKSAQFLMNTIFWLTWHVRLQNLCELQLNDWDQGRDWGLAVPKPRRGLFRWLCYIHIEEIVSFFVEAALGLHWQVSSFGSLMTYDDFFQRWREADVPFITNSRVRSSFMATRGSKSDCNTYKIAQSHHRLQLLLWWSPCLHRNMLIFHTIQTRDQSSNPEATKLKTYHHNSTWVFFLDYNTLCWRITCKVWKTRPASNLE